MVGRGWERAESDEKRRKSSRKKLTLMLLLESFSILEDYSEDVILISRKSYEVYPTCRLNPQIYAGV